MRVLSTEAEGRGGQHPPRSAEFFISCDTPNSIIALLFIQNNSNFKNKLKMPTSVDVKFTSILHLFREI